jgi:hypothetical protein
MEVIQLTAEISKFHYVYKRAHLVKADSSENCSIMLERKLTNDNTQT